ncbi:MAG TPA: F0F1 ATP synthase subunit B [Candidatus Saccharibacteria bacterium]|nr:F0F1 ATP synthase subunit B [Candidatus Saccharibacteria bacterium]HRQ98299.1 F0F1 ATP synthase subunit B [Candidatus Saccharibacteria bacterium]
MVILTQFAETTSGAPEGDIFTTLGIDWKTLILQIVAFLILVWLLKKLVYPVLMKSVDKRQEDIESASKLADEAKKQAEGTKDEIAKLLKEARAQANDVVQTAKQEATAAIELAEKKAKKHAESIIENAHTQLDRDVLAAKKALRNETIELVALATEKIVKTKIDTKADQALIESAIKDAV